MLKAVIKRRNIDISGAEPLRACVILLSAFTGAFLEEGCNCKKALERLLCKLKRRGSCRHNIRLQPTSLALRVHTLPFHSASPLEFFFFFKCALSQVRV